MSNPFKENIRVDQGEFDNNSVKKGKHYVMSDIHGMYGSYIEAISKMSKEDELIIVGDVIDRGKYGIKILLDIIERQKNPGNGPKITFLLGNHELMLLSTIQIMINHNLVGNELELLRKSDNFADFYNGVKGIGINPEEAFLIMNWVKGNHGDKTIFKYFREIEPRQMKEIYNFLLRAYVVLPQKIEDKDYLFVHSMPINNKTKLEEMKNTGKGYNVMELTPEEYEFMLKQRDKKTYKLAQEVGFTTICGHTPCYGGIENEKENGFIRIDVGCGHKKEVSRLALYCIEDNQVEYIYEKEEASLDGSR